MNTLLVLTNLPDRATAETLAARLVEDRLAACVNILPPCHSIYRWQGEVETADEVIRARHPYETPEIIALPVLLGLPGYLAWVAAETQSDDWSAP